MNRKKEILVIIIINVLFAVYTRFCLGNTLYIPFMKSGNIFLEIVGWFLYGGSLCLILQQEKIALHRFKEVFLEIFKAGVIIVVIRFVFDGIANQFMLFGWSKCKEVCISGILTDTFGILLTINLFVFFTKGKSRWTKQVWKPLLGIMVDILVYAGVIIFVCDKIDRMSKLAGATEENLSKIDLYFSQDFLLPVNVWTYAVLMIMLWLFMRMFYVEEDVVGPESNKMQKKRLNMLISTIALTIVMYFVFVFGTIDAQVGKLVSSEPFEWSQTVDNFTYIEAGTQTEGSLCLIAPSRVRLSDWHIAFNSYLIFQRVKGKEQFFHYKQRARFEYEYEEFYIDLYNFITGKIEKSFDMLAISKEYTPGKMCIPGRDIYADIIGGRKYLQWEAYEMDRDGLAEKIVYDVDNGQVVDSEEIGDGQGDWSEEEKAYYQSIYILTDYKCNFLEVNHFTSREEASGSREEFSIYFEDSWKDGIIEVEMPASMLPENNIRLYGEFPELKSYRGREDSVVKLFLAGYPNAEEVLEMLLEEGTKVTYEGCILREDGSIDRELCEVSDLNDYIKMRWWQDANAEFVHSADKRLSNELKHVMVIFAAVVFAVVMLFVFFKLLFCRSKKRNK